MAGTISPGMTDAQVAQLVANAGYTGNDAVYTVAAVISGETNQRQITPAALQRAVQAVGGNGGSVPKVSATPGATSAGNTPTVTPGTLPGTSVGQFSSILSKSLWVRIGIGALGAAMAYGGYLVLQRNNIKDLLS